MRTPAVDSRHFGAEERSTHFATVRDLLDDAGIPYEFDPTLVRGLDYYTRTLFEFTSDALGAQSGVAGGGRYDRLIEQLGGHPTPASGWAAGVERMLLAAGDLPHAPELLDLYVARVGEQTLRRAFDLSHEARRAGLSVQLELAGRSLKGQLKQADRAGARYVAIVEGDGHATIKNMESGEQRELAPRRDPDDPARIEAVKHAPRPNGYRDTWCGDLTAERAGTQAHVSGWVHRRRDHGGLIFIDLRDRSGVVQLVFHPDTAPAAHRAAHALRSEDVISVTGAVVRRPERHRQSEPADRRDRGGRDRARDPQPTPTRRRSRSTTPAATRSTRTCA